MIPPLSEVKEALTFIGGPAGSNWSGDYFLVNESVIAAARGLVELVESGQEVWWCDAHQSSVSSDYLESGNPCWFMMFAYRGDKGEFGRAHLPCRMVRKLLVDTPEE